jgi:hypothetical protein
MSEYKGKRQTFRPMMDGVPENLSRMHNGQLLVYSTDKIKYESGATCRMYEREVSSISLN